MLMLGEHENAAAAAAAAAQQGANVADLMNPTPMANGSSFGANPAAAMLAHNASAGRRSVGSAASRDIS